MVTVIGMGKRGGRRTDHWWWGRRGVWPFRLLLVVQLIQLPLFQAVKGLWTRPDSNFTKRLIWLWQSNPCPIRSPCTTTILLLTHKSNKAADKLHPLIFNCIYLLKHKLISLLNDYCQVLSTARDKFTREISFQSKDKDISLAKVYELPPNFASLLISYSRYLVWT